MKKLLFYSCSVVILITVSLLVYSCTKDQGKLEKFPIYSELYGENISPRSEEQNCCECFNNACCAKKCCSAPANCNCSCTDHGFFGSSCICDACSGSSSHINYEIWITSTQFGFWEDFADILDADGSDAADAALEELLNALDAVSTDDFDKYKDSKENLRANCLLLSSGTKTSINSLLTTNNFTDVL